MNKHEKYIRITLSNHDALVKTLDNLKNRIECQNRKPSTREQIAINVLEQEKTEIESVLRLNKINNGESTIIV